MGKPVTLCIAVVSLFLFILPERVAAEYVLPYPSAMPGNRVYRITRIVDSIKKYWYFGGISRTKYHMNLSDKYLVEAKTLMEYEQYLLAADALVRTDHEYSLIVGALAKASQNGIDITAMKKSVSEQSEKHIFILTALSGTVPPHVTWKPEKSVPTELPLLANIQKSVTIRKNIIEKMISF